MENSHIGLNIPLIDLFTLLKHEKQKTKNYSKQNPTFHLVCKKKLL